MLSGAIVPRAELSGGDIRRMYSLMARHYDGVTRGKFLADLEEKDGVLIVRGPDGSIEGFSTYLVRSEAGPAGGSRILFSGDTIVDARSWDGSRRCEPWAGSSPGCSPSRATRSTGSC